VKQKKLLIQFVISSALLFLIVLFFTQTGFKLQNKHISNTNDVKYAVIEDFFFPKNKYCVDIDAIVIHSDKKNIQPEKELKEVKKQIASLENNLPQRQEENRTYEIFDTIRASEAELLKNIHQIEFPDSNKTELYSFFDKLSASRNSKKPIRIMHYGDSQIEGDRITSLLRNNLQTQFGGSGVGLISIIDISNNVSVNKELSNNWTRYSIINQADSIIQDDRFGFLTSFVRFAPLYNDSLPNSEILNAWFSIRKSNLTNKLNNIYTKCRLFYANNKKPVILELLSDNAIIRTDTLKPTNQLSIVEWNFDKNQNELIFKFSGADSPDIYAVALDNNSGVAVDNIALRGSSGLFFTSIDGKHLRKAFSELQPELFILQFGSNVIPYIREDYNFYKRWYLAQIKQIRKLRPTAAIIVVSPADMAMRQGNRYVSYPSVEKVRTALREAAFETGCAFWDLYAAMGGENSMTSWVYAEPALAGHDFVHFNYRGAKIIAEMFYNSFIYEYNQYLFNKKH